MYAAVEAALMACAPRLDPTRHRAWVNALRRPMADAEINSARRIAAFIGQCAHESAGFTVVAENLYYRADRLCAVWPSRFPTIRDAEMCAMRPEKIANRVYANRMGNGSEASGDGYKFRGRGIIQLTGRDNYRRFAQAIGFNIDDAVAYAGTDDGAAESATFFWMANGLNPLADAWAIDSITRRINGGLNGAEDRRRLCTRALQAVQNVPLS